MAASQPSLSPTTDFGRLASVYDSLAQLVFGRAQLRAQHAALHAGLARAGVVPRVLVLGGGTGWVLIELLHQCPGAQVLYLEASAAMLTRAQGRLAQHYPAALAQVTFRQGSEQDLEPDEKFDVLITFFVLDCFPAPEFAGAMARLLATRQPGALWLVADFRPPQRWWQWILLRVMYLFFGVAVGLRTQQLPPWPTAFADSTLTCLYESAHYGGFILAHVWQ